MDSRNNICFLFLGAFLTLVAADAPLAPYALAAPEAEYDIPRVQLPLEPFPPAVPAPVYGVPQYELPPLKSISTSYKYEVLNLPHKPVEVLAPQPAPVLKVAPAPAHVRLEHYPAPVVPAPVYGLPQPAIFEPLVPITSRYAYNIPPQPVRILKSYATPVPVYGLPKIDIPVHPSPVYGVPRIEPHVPSLVYGVPRYEIPAKPVQTSYAYNLPALKVIQVQEKLAPYPAALPAVKIQEVPVVPHSQYGVPHH